LPSIVHSSRIDGMMSSITLSDVLVPRLDDVALDHRRHLDERRLADIDVPGASLFFASATKRSMPKPSTGAI